MNTWLWMRLHPAQRGPKLTANGRLDSSNIDTLLYMVAAALRIRGAKVVLLDLARVTYIDLAGITGLLRCRHLARRVGSTLQITGVSAQVLAAAKSNQAVPGLGLTTLSVPIGCITDRLRPTARRVLPTRRFCITALPLGFHAPRSR